MILLALAAIVVPSGQGFSCTVTHVHDGDGPAWCREGPRIRVAGIAAREIDGTCRSNQPCPAASAEASRDALINLTMGQTLRCRSVGKSFQRTVAWCWSPRFGDVSCAMLATGAVLVWREYWKDHRCR